MRVSPEVPSPFERGEERQTTSPMAAFLSSLERGGAWVCGEPA
jgi:hypothetical protein